MMDSVLASSVDYSMEEARGEAVRVRKRSDMASFKGISVTHMPIPCHFHVRHLFARAKSLGGLFNLTWRLADQLEPRLLEEWHRETVHTYPLLMGAFESL